MVLALAFTLQPASPPAATVGSNSNPFAGISRLASASTPALIFTLIPFHCPAVVQLLVVLGEQWVTVGVKAHSLLPGIAVVARNVTLSQANAVAPRPVG